jgi:hypothetical protein
MDPVPLLKPTPRGADKLIDGPALGASRQERRLGELRREIERAVDGIAKGIGDPHELGPA